MKKEKLVIILLDDDGEEHILFKEVANDFVEINSVISFFKGNELLAHLSDSSTIIPDILFLDLNMPILSGIDCLVEIRKNTRFKNLPIAIYSTSSSKNDMKIAYQNGADFYINKPFEYSGMEKILRKVLNINWKEHSSDRTFEKFITLV
jgi:DNA-binding response OmpR family regulator